MGVLMLLYTVLCQPNEIDMSFMWPNSQLGGKINLTIGY